MLWLMYIYIQCPFFRAITLKWLKKYLISCFLLRKFESNLLLIAVLILLEMSLKSSTRHGSLFKNSAVHNLIYRPRRKDNFNLHIS